MRHHAVEYRPVVESLPREFDELADVGGCLIRIEFHDKSPRRSVEDGLQLFEILLRRKQQSGENKHMHSGAILFDSAIYVDTFGARPVQTPMQGELR